MRLPSTVPAGRAWAPVPWWLRAFFLVNVVQDAGIGISGLLAPGHIVIPLKGLTPFNARFVASLYLGGGIVILLATLVRRAVDTRLALYSLFAITVLVLVMTFAYWAQFTVDGIPRLWLTTYVVDPLVAGFAVLWLGLIGAAEPGRHRFTALFIAQAAVFGGAGLALLLAPDAVLAAWPWTVTRLLARVYAAFFLAFALGAALAAHERRPAAVRPFLVGSLALLAFSLGVSLRHLDRFHDGPGPWLWFTVHLLGLALFAVALARLGRREGDHVDVAGARQ
jgi:hypothetical protein